MKRNITVEVAARLSNQTGESPVWSVADQALYWVDIPAAKLYRRRYDGQLDEWDMGERIGAVGFRRGGGLIATMQSGIYALDIDAAGAISRRVIWQADLPAGHRPKEGKCDFDGRWWFGSTGIREKPEGGLFRVSAEGACEQVDDNYHLPNGIAFSPDQRTMLVADSPDDTVFAYDLDAASGVIANRRTFFSTAELPGVVDGATFDADGGYWCAMIHDWAVARIDPDGRLDRIVRLPTRYPTMCAFGGPNLDILYVTSKCSSLKDEERDAQPLAGSLFAIHGLGVTGVAEPAFGR